MSSNTTISHLEFLHQIRCEITAGLSITPFVGSGISAASGIPMGENFDDYLAYVVYLTVEDNWDLQKNGWPATPSTSQIRKAKLRILEHYEICLKKYECVAVFDTPIDEDTNETEPAEELDHDTSNTPRTLPSIAHIISQTYNVKLITSDSHIKVPNQGSRVVIFYREDDKLRLFVYGTEETSKQDAELEKFDLTSLEKQLEDWWNQPLPERKKADLIRSLKSTVSNANIEPKKGEKGRMAYLALMNLSEASIPAPSTHRLSIQLKRPLVPSILRSRDIWRDEEHFDQLRRDMQIEDAPTDPNESHSSNSYIWDCALRALSHWTRTLEFLSRIRPGNSPSRAWLDEPDIAIIDSFNAHITRGRHPNLIHNMVARLSRNLRSRVILTTNFDTLIEESFRSQGEPLQVFAVSTRGGLPNHATVRAQDCLIKLHGDILETRADSTINESPSLRDKESFFNYLRGGNRPYLHQPREFLPSHLLVLGYSGSDARCIQMIKYVLDMDREFKVFWICYSQSDVENVKDLFADYLRDPTKESRSDPPQFFITQSERSDLFLWELYQVLNLSLPGGGYSFQFSHQIPPLSNDEKTASPDQRRKSKELATKILSATSKKRTGDLDKSQIVCIDSKSGVGDRISSVFEYIRSKGIQTVWFELEDYDCPLHFLNALLLSLSLRIGVFQREWHQAPQRNSERHDTHGDPRWLQQVRGFIEKNKIRPEDWALFLYGRNGPGGCCGWDVSYWTEEDYGELADTLEELRLVGFRVIYMGFGPERAKRNKSKSEFIEEKKIPEIPSFPRESYADWSRLVWKRGINPPVQNPVLIPEHHRKWEFKSFCDLSEKFTQEGSQKAGSSYEKIIEAVMEEFGQSDTPLHSARMIWLYGLTLFRQSRHTTALLSEAVFPCPSRFGTETDNDELRSLFLFGLESKAEHIHKSTRSEYTKKYKKSSVELKGWVNWLTDPNHRLFLRKPGGYQWKYRDTRLGLQYLLEHSGEYRFFSQALNLDEEGQKDFQTYASIWQLRGRIHYWIGDWYLRAYHSTQHHIPLLEAIYHSVQALVHSPYLETANVGNSSESRERLAFRSACQLRKLIHAGRKSFQFWMPGIDLYQNCFHGLGTESEPLKDWVSEDHFGELSDEDIPEDRIGDSRYRIGRDGARRRIREEIENAQAEICVLNEAVKGEGVPHGPRRRYFHTTRSFTKEKEEPQRNSTKLGEIEFRHRTELISETNDWYSGTQASLARTNLRIEKLWRRAEKATVAETFIGSEIYHDFSEIRSEIFQWWREVCDSREGDLLQLVWALSELGYSCARRAVLIRYAHSKTDSSGQIRERNHWQLVSAICHMSIQLIRSVSPDHYESDCKLRIQILTLYGMSLGYLQRFKEGHRRFNEAHALLVSGLSKLDGRELAKIHIRRADMILIRGRSLMPAEPEPWPPNEAQRRGRYRKVLACIDDAWSSLERALVGMRGINHSSFWWYRLRILELKTYAQLAELKHPIWNIQNFDETDLFLQCLPFRRRQDYAVTLIDLLRDCLMLADGDNFRQLRAINHFVEAAALVPVGENAKGYPSSAAKRNQSNYTRKYEILGVANDRKTQPGICVFGFEEDDRDVAETNKIIETCWESVARSSNHLILDYLETVEKLLDELVSE